MKVDEVIAALGLDEETAKIVRAKVNDEKTASLRAAQEFAKIEQEKQALEAELVADGKKGARNYKQWYDQNYDKIVALQTKYTKLVERYGDPDQTTTTTTTSQPTTTTAQPGVMTEAEFQKRMEAYTAQWANLVTGQSEIFSKHFLNGRKTPLDKDAIQKISTLAAEKHGGNLVAAYDEWDRPEADKAAKDAEEKRINAEVDRRMKAKQTQSFFPTTEQTPSGISPLSKDRGEAPKYDRNKVVESAITGLYEPTTVQ